MQESKKNFSASDFEYDKFQEKLVAFFISKSLKFTISTDESKKVKELQAEWIRTFSLSADPSTKTKVVTLEKTESRKALTEYLRFLVAKHITGNDKVTNGDRESLGLTVKDKKPTPVPKPVDVPFMEIDFKIRGQHNGALWTNTFIGEKKRKQKRPKGVAFAVVRWGILPNEPRNIEDLPSLILTSDSKFTINFSKENKGKTVYYAACWSNAKGQMGAWTEITNVIIN